MNPQTPTPGQPAQAGYGYQAPTGGQPVYVATQPAYGYQQAPIGAQPVYQQAAYIPVTPVLEINVAEALRVVAKRHIILGILFIVLGIIITVTVAVTTRMYVFVFPLFLPISGTFLVIRGAMMLKRANSMTVYA